MQTQIRAHGSRRGLHRPLGGLGVGARRIDIAPIYTATRSVATEPLEGAGDGCPASAAHPSAETGLDTAALGRLRELDPTGTSGLVERVFRAFAGSLERLMPQLHAAQIGADWNAVRHVAHTLKSSSASVGAIKLSLLCAEIETMIRTDNLDAGRAHRTDGA